MYSPPVNIARLWLPWVIAADPAGISARYGQRTRSQVIYRENKMRVLHYAPSVPRCCPVPLVMIAPILMPHYIMDLHPRKSLVEYFLARGLDVFMIDWGVPDDGDRFDTLDRYITRYLRHAIDAVGRISEQPQVTLHGYCQGGLLAILFAALFPDQVRNLVSQTGPVNFHDEGIFSLWAQNINADLLVDTLGNVPAAMLRMTFQSLNPMGALVQTLRLYEHIDDEPFVQDYIALNTWLNDIVPLPGELFRKFVKDLYQRNLLIRGELEVGGARVDLHRITCPVLTIAGETDNVVPWRSAAALNDCVSSVDKHLLLLKSGHLGMTIGHGAREELWRPLADWVIQRSGGERSPLDV